MNRLTENHFSFKCPMNWDDMKPMANGRFCDRCMKEVFDLTNCSLDEVAALQRKHGSICGSIRMAQAAVVAASLTVAACKETLGNRTTGAPMPVKNDWKNVMLGSICPMPPKSDHGAKPDKE